MSEVVKRVFYLTLIMLTGQAGAQSNFVTIHEQVSGQFARGVIESANRDFFVVGIMAGIEHYPGTYILKADKNGKVLWTRYYGGRYEFEIGLGIIETSSGYLVLSFIGGVGTELMLINEDGEPAWRKLLAEDPTLVGYSMGICPDGGVLISGEIRDNPATDIFVLKTDNQGNVLWKKTFGLPDKRDVSETIIPLEDGFVVMGNTTELKTHLYYGNVVVFKCDYSGNVIWKKIYDQADLTNGFDMIKTRDGNYVITYRDNVHEFYMSLMKIDQENGNLIWDKPLYWPSWGVGNALAEGADGTIKLAGFSATTTPPYPEPPRKPMVWSVSPQGDIQWAKKLDISEKHGEAFAMVHTSDDNFAIGGFLYDPVLEHDVFLIKMGDDGCIMGGPELGPDTETCGENIRLDAGKDFTAYSWSTGSVSQSIAVNTEGKYYVSVKNKENCTRTDTITVSVKNCAARDVCRNVNYTAEELIIPNIITPNEDGLNDYFMLNDILAGSSLKILNRWGRVVYNTSNYVNNWSGGELEAGNYFYFITNPCFSKSFKGALTLKK